jgi:hypothetical protein
MLPYSLVAVEPSRGAESGDSGLHRKSTKPRQQTHFACYPVLNRAPFRGNGTEAGRIR